MTQAPIPSEKSKRQRDNTKRNYSSITDPCKPEVRPGAREESASPAWLAAPAMNAHDTTKVFKWKLDTGCGPTLYRKCHSHNTPGKRHNNTWVEPLAGNCTTSSTRQREQVWQKCKIQKNWCTVTVAPTIEHHGLKLNLKSYWIVSRTVMKITATYQSYINFGSIFFLLELRRWEVQKQFTLCS